MDEGTWYNERGKHRKQRSIQEFVLRTSTQAAVPMEKRGEDRREAAKSKQKAREKMSERMRRADEGKTAESIWDLLGTGQEKIVKVRNADQERRQSGCDPNSREGHTHMKEATVGRWRSGAASSVITTAASGICEVEKSEGGKCANSLLREGNVGGKWSSAASSGDRWDGCESPVVFDTQAPHVKELPVQATSTGREREKEREMERRECCTHTLDSECWLSDSGSQWVEAEVNSASSVTVTQGKSIPRRNAGRSDGYDAPGQDKHKKDHDERTNEAKSIVARYRGIAWTIGKKYGNAILRSCNELEKWLGEHREEPQQGTSREIVVVK